MRGVFAIAEIFCVLAASLMLVPAKAEQTKLRVTPQQPVTGHLGVNLVRFKEEVERRTEGALALEVFDNSRLYKDNEALGAVASGAIEMATIAAAVRC